MSHVQKRDDRWQARFRGPDGRERTKRFDRKVDAENWLTINGADIVRGAWVDPDAGRITLKAYADQWLKGRNDLRPTTRAKYESLLNLHVNPTLGEIAIGRLSPAAVRHWQSVLTRSHAATAASVYRLLATICRTAANDELIARSPCRVKGASKERADERPTATVAEVSAAVEAAPERWKLALLLAVWCQLRRGEILGLQRGDVDQLHGTISVERTFVAVSGGSPVIGPPKTDAGRRLIAIPPNVTEALEVHLTEHVGSANNAWLFPGAGDSPAVPKTLSHVWSTTRDKVSRPDLRLHDLRHTGLTWAAATGASTAEIMRRGGHSSPTAALRYQHATADRDRVLADALGALAAPPIIDLNQPDADKLRTEPESEAEDEGGSQVADQGVEGEHPQRDSNPCYHLERVAS